jgi:hypothetical protein
MALEDAKNPLAGASGPGKFAKRTDLQYQPTEYGAGVAMDATKAGAPLASSPSVNGATNTAVRQAAAKAPMTSLYAPTERPNEPVTNGINIGPGAGAEALNLPQTDNTNFNAAIRSYMPVLAYVADLPNTSPETRQAIRQLRDQIG